MKTFTDENIDNLSEVSRKISRLLELPGGNDDNFTPGQLKILSSLIKDFIDNPIVKNLGILPNE